MTKRPVKLLVWGLLFILIDLRIGTLDIVHDLIGYILLYKGLNLLPESRWLTYAKISAVILGIISITEILGVSQINLNEMNQDYTWYVIIGGFISLLSLFFHINLLSGLLDVVDSDHLQETFSSLSKFKTFYLVYNLIITLSLPSILVFQEMFGMFLVLLLIAGLIIELVYIVKINSFKRFPLKEEGTS